MSNYEQMELNITLDGERELKENVMLSVEFAYDQLKSYELPNVANRYEGYGIAANMWSQLAAKEKGVKDSMKHFLVTLDIGGSRQLSKRHPLCTIQLRRSFILRQTWQHTSTRL